MIGHIVLRVLRRATRLRIHIDTEHREVTGLTRPHPVVCLTTELSHRLWQGKHQTYILIVAVGRGIELVSLIEP